MADADSTSLEALPDFQSLMLPVLEDAARGEVRIGETIERLADRFALSEEQRARLLPSKRQGAFANRVHWAKFYLSKAGLVRITRRGHFEITETGRGVLENAPARIDINFLKQFSDFQSFREDLHGENNLANAHTSVLTPDDQMRQARDLLEANLAQDLLERVRHGTSSFFEKVVVKLLTEMGYGGSVHDAGRVLGRSSDGGVDGVIDQDALGLDRIYVQAKCYNDRAVGANEIRDFFGALDQVKASKGVFVTSSRFTAEAEATAAKLSRRIVLIDGQMLAKLMIRHDVGCRVEEQLTIKNVDEDFFES